MTSSEDRWTYPAEGEDPRDAEPAQQDAEATAEREATRHVTHEQDADGEQGLSSDRPGVDPSDRHHTAEGGLPAAD